MGRNIEPREGLIQNVHGRLKTAPAKNAKKSWQAQRYCHSLRASCNRAANGVRGLLAPGGEKRWRRTDGDGEKHCMQWIILMSDSADECKRSIRRECVCAGSRVPRSRCGPGASWPLFNHDPPPRFSRKKSNMAVLDSGSIVLWADIREPSPSRGHPLHEGHRRKTLHRSHPAPACPPRMCCFSYCALFLLSSPHRAENAGFRSAPSCIAEAIVGVTLHRRR